MSTIKTETLSTPSNATVPVDTVVNGTAKAWVNFNGTGTVAIRRAFNVASITDNGTGDYTLNFTNAMADAGYGAVFGGGRNSTGSANITERHNANIRTTTQLRIYTLSEAWNTIDPDFVSVTIFS